MFSLLFSDGAISIDPLIGGREMCVSLFRNIRRELLGDSLNSDNQMGEGGWADTHTLRGYDVNVDALTIRLPDAKIRGSWEMVNDPVSKPGNIRIQVGKVQTLRGLFNHWVGASRFWKYMGAPFNALL